MRDLQNSFVISFYQTTAHRFIIDTGNDTMCKEVYLINR